MCSFKNGLEESLFDMAAHSELVKLFKKSLGGELKRIGFKKLLSKSFFYPVNEDLEIQLHFHATTFGVVEGVNIETSIGFRFNRVEALHERLLETKEDREGLTAYRQVHTLPYWGEYKGFSLRSNDDLLFLVKAITSTCHAFVDASALIDSLDKFWLLIKNCDFDAGELSLMLPMNLGDSAAVDIFMNGNYVVPIVAYLVGDDAFVRESLLKRRAAMESSDSLLPYERFYLKFINSYLIMPQSLPKA